MRLKIVIHCCGERAFVGRMGLTPFDVEEGDPDLKEREAQEAAWILCHPYLHDAERFAQDLCHEIQHYMAEPPWPFQWKKPTKSWIPPLSWDAPIEERLDRLQSNGPVNWELIEYAELDDLDPDWLRVVTDDYHGNMPEPGGSAGYDHLHHAPYTPYVRCADEEPWVEPPYTGFSDYSGSTVERANQAGFLEAFPDVFCQFYGGHGTEVIACPLRLVTSEMLEMMNSLSGYPVLDDAALSELEIERDDEAWDSWARDDFVGELQKRIRDFSGDDAPDEVIDGAEGLCDKLDDFDGDLRQFFEDARESINTYWEDDGAQRWVDVRRVAAAVSMVDLIGLLTAE